MTTLVTGATGFIGANLVRFLLAKGHTIRALCRPTSNTAVFDNQPVHIYPGDILDLSSLERAVQDCDYVFHLAGYAKNWAKRPETFFDANVTGTRNVLQASIRADVKKVVFTSSCMTFGPSSNMPTVESHKRTAGFFCEYERTKFYAEQVATDYVESGLPVMVVNPTRLFGPGLLTEGNFVTKMIRSYLHGRWRAILADGSAIGNYAFVDDVVRGHWLALEHGQPGQKYILGGEDLSLNEFFAILAHISRKQYKMIHVPAWLVMAFSNFLAVIARRFGIHPLFTPDWVRVMIQDWAFSSKKAERELGLPITPFREGLRKTVEWLTNGSPQVDGVC